MHRNPHWRVLVGPVLAFLLVVGAAGYVAALARGQGWQQWGWPAVAASALLLIAWLTVLPLVRWRTTHLVVTTRRLLVREGVHGWQGIQVPLDGITAVHTRRSSLRGRDRRRARSWSSSTSPVRSRSGTPWAESGLSQPPRRTRQGRVVHVAVGGQGVAAVVGRDAVEVGQPPARLVEDRDQRGEVPDAGRPVDRHVDHPLGDEAVLPEVAERPRLPAGVGQRDPALQVAALGERAEVGGGQVGVGEVGDPGDGDPPRRAPVLRRPRAQPLRTPPAAAQRRGARDARRRRGRARSARSAWPRPGTPRE